MRISWLILFLVALPAWAVCADPVKTDLEVARSRLLAVVRADARISAADCDRWVNTLASDGSWPDLDYDDDRRSGWAPRMHWRRIRDLSFQSATGQVSDDPMPDAGPVIERAIRFWIDEPPVCTNWWYNAIGIPLEMGPALLALGTELDARLRDGVIDLMNHPPGGSSLAVDDGAYSQTATGQNLVWLAWIQLMMGLASENEAWILNASRQVSDVVVVTTEEGIQPDFSFHQHGPQYYSGGYGLSFTKSVGDIITVVHGTEFSLSKAAETVFLEFVLGGQGWIARGDALIFHSRGREIARPFRGPSVLGKVAGSLAEVGMPRSDELRRLSESVRGDLPWSDLDGVKMFYRSDVAIQQNRRFSISVRGTSFRLRGGESGNGENILGQYLAHGAHAILRHGAEYQDVFPLWDWRRIPGGLIAADAELSLFDWGMGKPVRSGFVGGVSTGSSACFGYDYDFEGTRAKRSWFLTDEGMIQLVADVSDREGRDLVQTLNQCRAIGPVSYLTGEGIVTAPQSLDFNDSLSSVEHDGVGYVFPESRKVRLEVETRVGSWRTINLTGSDTPISDDVFSLSFDLAPDDHEGYHYFVLPGALSDIEGSAEAVRRWKIIRNDADCQAIHDTRENELLAVFYAQGRVTLENGFSLRVRQPCTVILEFGAEGLVIHAADPTKSLDRIALSVSGSRLDLDLPQGSLRGKAIEPVRLAKPSE